MTEILYNQKGKKRSKTNKIQEWTAGKIVGDLELQKRQLTEEEQELINKVLEKDYDKELKVI